MKTRYRRVVEIVKDTLTDIEAKGFIVEARINCPGELDVYEACGNGNLMRVFTIPAPGSLKSLDSDGLLRYARNNMPENITFGV